MSFERIKRQIIKKGRLANVLWPLRSNGLYCFNFHRIGDATTTAFDPCVFSCDIESFQQYLDFLQSNFRIIDLKELYAIIREDIPIKEKLALITFDDGYRDNYEVAFPILKSMNIPATFFITTSLVGSKIIPWWDEIAWHLRQIAGQSLKLSMWSEAVLVPKSVNTDIIRQVLGQVKSFPAQIDSQLKELKALSNKKIPTALSDNLFVQWPDITELANSGMNIGAHSHTHRVLSTLTSDELVYELTESKRLLENFLHKPIASLSYPVGGESTYNNTMFKLLDEIGYQSGFTFRNMVTKNITQHKFELGRLSIDRAFDEQFLKEMILTAPKV